MVRVPSHAGKRLGVLILGALVLVSSGWSSAPRGPGPWWSRAFETPETLPTPYPYCCGSYWDTLLLSATSAGRIRVDPTDRGNHVFASEVGSNSRSDYADWSILTQNDAQAHGIEGESVWVRQRIFFPADFKPTGYTAGQVNSEWNWLTEFHEVAGWRQKCATEDPANISLGVLNGSPARHHGTANVRFRLRLMGGTQTSTRCQAETLRIDGPRIRRRHWYTILAHVVFSPSRSGLVEVWIDGARMARVRFPTLYRHPDGTVGRDYFQAGYYRLRAPWPTTVFYDDIRAGPTRLSITRMSSTR